MKGVSKLDGIRYDKELVESLIEKWWEKLDKKLDVPGEELIRFFQEQSIGAVERYCESPIEKQFAYGLYWVSLIEGLFVEVVPPQLFAKLILSEPKSLDESGLALAKYLLSTDLIIVPNPKINLDKKEYRADFLIAYKEKGRKKRHLKLVECDSFMFHSSAKQLTHDKRRERELRAVGWDLIRFSGQELHHNPSKVAYEILESFLKYGEK